MIAPVPSRSSAVGSGERKLMTSVTCNVCTKNIANENDRIYCFGGCEKILHSRCAELNTSAAAALRENKSLQYMCFGCRRKQTTLNDIQKQNAELMGKIDDLCERVNKHESLLTGLTTADLKKIESTLVPRILAAIKNAPNTCTHVAPQTNRDDAPNNSEHVAANTASYANVTRNRTNSITASEINADRATKVSNSNELASPASEQGGLLRSGRRRLVVPRTNTIASSAAQSTPQLSTLLTPLAEQKKSNTVARLEQTVLFIPKNDQSSEKTKDDICLKFDPVAFSVKEVRLRQLGEVAVRCGTKELAQKMVNSASALLSGQYSVELLKPLKPRIKIVSFSEEMNEEILLKNLKKQNNLTDQLDLKVVRLTKNKKRKHKPMSALIETDARGFDTLMKLQRVYLGWERCRLVDATEALRCFNCSEFGHKASDCTKPACCPKCAGDHKVDDCEADFEKCINCHVENAKRKNESDALLDVTHPVWSNECPINRKRIAKARKRIDF